MLDYKAGIKPVANGCHRVSQGSILPAPIRLVAFSYELGDDETARDLIFPASAALREFLNFLHMRRIWRPFSLSGLRRWFSPSNQSVTKRASERFQSALASSKISVSFPKAFLSFLRRYTGMSTWYPAA